MSSPKNQIRNTLDKLGTGAAEILTNVPPQIKKLFAKEHAVETILIIIIVMVVIIILFWLYNTFTLSNTNCNNLEKVYGNSILPLQNINANNAAFGGNLVDYYIKTAYNCCCGGNFKNDFVDSEYTNKKLCAVTNCIQQGARCLDFEIYSYKDKPVIAASSVDSFDIKETFNYLKFEDAMNWISNAAFSTAFCSNNTDPLILNLRIMSNNIKIYPLIANAIIKEFSDEHKLSTEYCLANYCNNLGKQPLLKFKNKVIVIIDNNTFQNLINACPMAQMENCKTNTKKNIKKDQTQIPTEPETLDETITISASSDLSTTTSCLLPNLLEVAHMHSGSPYFNTMRNYELKIKSDINSLQNYNKSAITLLLPDYEPNATNTNPSIGMNYGCQLVGMSFQNFDANMEFYTLFFNEKGSAFAYKPASLRFIQKYVSLPPKLPDYINVAPKKINVETSLGTHHIATFPIIPTASDKEEKKSK